MGYISIELQKVTNIPRELLFSDVTTIRDYLSAGIRFGVAEVSEFRLILCGKFEAGKTCISVALRSSEDCAPRVSILDRTVGVEVKEWKLPSNPPAIVHIWDFAGQEEYYALHRVFLSHRCLYCVVVKPSSGSTMFDDENWALTEVWIRSLHAHMPKAEFLLVVAEHNGVQCSGSRSGIRRIKDLVDSLNLAAKEGSHEKLKNDDKLRFKTVCVDAVAGKGVAELREAIRDWAKNQPFIKELIPKSYMRFRANWLGETSLAQTPLFVTRRQIEERRSFNRSEEWDAVKFWELLGLVLIVRGRFVCLQPKELISRLKWLFYPDVHSIGTNASSPLWTVIRKYSSDARVLDSITSDCQRWERSAVISSQLTRHLLHHTPSEEERWCLMHVCFAAHLLIPVLPPRNDGAEAIDGIWYYQPSRGRLPAGGQGRTWTARSVLMVRYLYFGLEELVRAAIYPMMASLKDDRQLDLRVTCSKKASSSLSSFDKNVKERAGGYSFFVRIDGTDFDVMVLALKHLVVVFGQRKKEVGMEFCWVTDAEGDSSTEVSFREVWDSALLGRPSVMVTDCTRDSMWGESLTRTIERQCGVVARGEVLSQCATAKKLVAVLDETSLQSLLTDRNNQLQLCLEKSKNRPVVWIPRAPDEGNAALASQIQGLLFAIVRRDADVCIGNMAAALRLLENSQRVEVRAPPVPNTSLERILAQLQGSPPLVLAGSSLRDTITLEDAYEISDPVITPNGDIYERWSISSWIRDHGSCPKSRLPLTEEDLVPVCRVSEEEEEIGPPMRRQRVD